MQSKSIKLMGLVLTLALLLVVVQVASADIKAVNVFYAWDRTQLEFLNSNVDIWYDGLAVNMIHELDTDNDDYTIVAADVAGDAVASCGYPSGDNTTDFAGRMELGLYHRDTGVVVPNGFDHSDSWRLIHCDQDGDGDFDAVDRAVDLTANPPTVWAVDADPAFEVISIDVLTACGTGNCSFEIVTTMFANLDSDCDNSTADEGLPAGGVCFFAKAYTPVGIPSSGAWTGNAQGRITAGGGDKTVNFNFLGPTAIELTNLTASSGSTPLVISLALAVLIGATLVLIVLRRRSLNI